MKPAGPVSKSNASPVPIPLPTELPDAPSLDALPPSVLHSATVETLLQQVDDLTARLKVNLRRNSLLEMDLKKSKDNLEFLKSRNQSLELKSLVEKEKQSRAEKRFEGLSSRIQELEGQLSVYEMRLSEALIQTHNLSSEKERLAKEALYLNTLKARIKSRLRNYLHRRTASLKEQVHALQVDLEGERTAAGNFRRRYEETSSVLTEMTQRLQDKEQELRKRELEFESHTSSLSSDLKAQIKSLEVSLNGQAEKASSLQAELIQAEDAFNRAIGLESRLKSQKEYYEIELGRLQKDLKAYRTEAKSLALEKSDLSLQLKEMRETLHTQSEYVKSLEDQLESAHLMLNAEKEKPTLEESRPQAPSPDL